MAKQWIRWYGIALLVIASAIWAAGCGNRQSTGTRSVKIGVMAPMTGDVASWGEMQKNATELALEDAKAAGGMSDLRIKVIYEDDKASPKDGVNAFQKLANADDVPIVVGSPASTVTLAVAPIANHNKVVLLSSGSTATAVRKAGPYVFRIMPSDEVQASIMADWAMQLGYKRVAIIYTENAWGRGLMDQFRADFTKKGGSVLAVESCKTDATDYRAQLGRVKAVAPDAIYAPVYTRGAGLMIRQARELGMNQQVLGADVYETPELVEAGRDAVNGVLYTTYGQRKGNAYKKFASEYKRKYGRDPEAYASYCYDAFAIALRAIEHIPTDKPIDGPGIRTALLATKGYQGVTGLSNFDGKNSASGKTFDKMMVVSKKHLPFSTEAWKRSIHRGD